MKTKIEWATDSWNPIRARGWDAFEGRQTVGWHCEHVSEGCRHCYAETMNQRRGTGLDFKPENIGKAEICLDEKMLLAPLSWRKPRRIFVCSMTDLFGYWVKDGWLDRLFAVMALCPQHEFQVLTKRPKRMRNYVRYLCNRDDLIADAALKAAGWPTNAHPDRTKERRFEIMQKVRNPHEPLSNLWLGVSAEDQETADERIPDLLATPAAVRFVSCEPMLGPIYLTEWLHARECDIVEHGVAGTCDCQGRRKNKIDWIICGGESGRGARPMQPDWARSLRDQCAAASVPFFFKQWGEWGPGTAQGRGSGTWIVVLIRAGKKRAGRLLDGREHNEFPRGANVISQPQRLLQPSLM